MEDNMTGVTACDYNEETQQKKMLILNSISPRYLIIYGRKRQCKRKADVSQNFPMWMMTWTSERAEKPALLLQIYEEMVTRMSRTNEYRILIYFDNCKSMQSGCY